MTDLGLDVEWGGEAERIGIGIEHTFRFKAGGRASNSSEGMVCIVSALMMVYSVYTGGRVGGFRV